MKKRIYISLPITGHDEKERRNYANRIAAILQVKFPTCEIINPFCLGDELIKEDPLREYTWNDYMEKDLAELVNCDTIYMCGGWENSKGCRIEHKTAVELGLEICYSDVNW